jgi:hypothetical protein
MYTTVAMNNATIPTKVLLIYSILGYRLKADPFTLRDEQCGVKLQGGFPESEV